MEGEAESRRQTAETAPAETALYSEAVPAFCFLLSASCFLLISPYPYCV
jgi:hypothetical protein